MIRKIKFRAWDKDLNKMFQVKKLEFMGKTILVGEIKEKCAGGNDIESQNYIEEIELMQFTGLNDKNGKEIYEEDILRLSNLPISPIDYKVLFENGRFVCGEIDLKTVLDLCNGEVIGNIFENPELLEKKK